MKSNIAIALGILGLIVWGIYSVVAYEGYERHQGFFLLPFAAAIACIFYIATRDRIGK
jgi:hypothetical protein